MITSSQQKVSWDTFRFRSTLQTPPSFWDRLHIRLSGLMLRKKMQAKQFIQQAHAIINLQSALTTLSDQELQTRLKDCQQRMRRGNESTDLLAQALAAICEQSRRSLNMLPYPVQIAGGLVIWHGGIAEMATGEGKTLVATLPAILAGWQGNGCHVLTDNAYLAKRDAEIMRPLYEACGVTVGFLDPEANPHSRQAAYACDITYGTSNEVASDYLYDRLDAQKITSVARGLISQLTQEELPTVRQRGLPFAIVDETDAVLIDGCITPLVISGRGESDLTAKHYQSIDSIAKGLKKNDHFKIFNDESITLTESGKNLLRRANPRLRRHLSQIQVQRQEEMVTTSLRAHHCRQRDKQYIVADNRIIVIDEATGRPRPSIQWGGGLHQATEAKEGVKINLPTITKAQISYQRFFNLYSRLGGMTGTAANARNEFWSIFHLPVCAIPTHRPNKRSVTPPQCFATTERRNQAVVVSVQQRHASGQPVLIGTATIHCSEKISEALNAAGITHTVLNARDTAGEADIIAAAGHRGAVTIATNMAGRGTDIKLAKNVAELGGLHVIVAEWQAGSRSYRQLIGRSGRQGDPGSAESLLATDDLDYQKIVPWAHLSSLALQSMPAPLAQRITRLAFTAGQHWHEGKQRRQRQHILVASDKSALSMGMAGAST